MYCVLTKLMGSSISSFLVEFLVYTVYTRIRKVVWHWSKIGILHLPLHGSTLLLLHCRSDRCQDSFCNQTRSFNSTCPDIKINKENSFSETKNGTSFSWERFWKSSDSESRPKIWLLAPSLVEHDDFLFFLHFWSVPNYRLGCCAT